MLRVLSGEPRVERRAEAAVLCARARAIGTLLCNDTAGETRALASPVRGAGAAGAP